MSEDQRAPIGAGLGTGGLALPPLPPPKRKLFGIIPGDISDRGISIIILVAVLSIILLSTSFLAYTTQNKQEPLAFPLKPGSISDIHTYPNGDTITIPFVSVNNIPLTISYPSGVYFPQGDISNHNNTYVPVQPIPSDPVCSTGQFYSESGQCLWASSTCPTGQQSNYTGMCFSPPQCPSSDYKYDESSRLCVSSTTWPVDCSPNAHFLNQEGWVWTIPPGDTTTTSDRTSNGTDTITVTNSIGFVAQWMMPNGTITGYKAGVFYNPVNFYQNVPGDPTKYMFYQVDYGVGKVLGNRTGLIMTTEQGGSGIYPFIKLNNVTVVPGSKYWVAGVLEPSPLAVPPAYVVQIIHGNQSWVYETEIDDINPNTSPVYRYQSFQDEWISTDFASNLTRDEISYPIIISVDNNNNIKLDSILNAINYSSLDQNIVTSGSFKLLSPHLTTPLPSTLSSPLPSQPYAYTDSRDCQGYGDPSNDTDVQYVLPSDPLNDGQYTIIHPPSVPEFGTGSIVLSIAVSSIVLVFFILRQVFGKNNKLFPV